MIYLCKVALFCDNCKTKVEYSPKPEPILGFDWEQDSPLKGWIGIGDNYNLCPDCAKVYYAKQAEFEQEFKEYLKILTNLRYNL